MESQAGCSRAAAVAVLKRNVRQRHMEWPEAVLEAIDELSRRGCFGRAVTKSPVTLRGAAATVGLGSRKFDHSSRWDWNRLSRMFFLSFRDAVALCAVSSGHWALRSQFNTPVEDAPGHTGSARGGGGVKA